MVWLLLRFPKAALEAGVKGAGQAWKSEAGPHSSNFLVPPLPREVVDKALIQPQRARAGEPQSARPQEWDCLGLLELVSSITYSECQTKLGDLTLLCWVLFSY